MLEIAPGIAIDEAELKLSFVLASGPGGQHVNKNATAVQLQFDILQARGIPHEVRQRLIKLAGKKVNGTGVLTLVAQSHRSQTLNRQEALDRLAHLIRRALVKPAPRKKTKPTKASKKRRLEQKSRRGTVKSLRKKVTSEDH